MAENQAENSSDLDTAIGMALSAHAGQTDKAGAPYILHPLRVMLAGNSEIDRIVGVLHDTVEDSAVTLDHLRETFGAGVAEAVDALTKRDGESYTGFIHRCGENEVARRVKIRDLSDNMDLRRLGREHTLDDAKRQQKYSEALALLSALESAD